MMSRALPYYLEDRTGVHTSSDFDDTYDRLFLRVSESKNDGRPPAMARSTSSSSSVSSLGSSPLYSSPLSSSPPYPSSSYSSYHLTPNPSSSAQSQPVTIAISNSGRRTSTREYLHGQQNDNRYRRREPEPAILLEFGRNGALGNVVFVDPSTKARTVMAMNQWLRKTGMFSGYASICFYRVELLTQAEIVLCRANSLAQTDESIGGRIAESRVRNGRSVSLRRPLAKITDLAIL